MEYQNIIFSKQNGVGKIIFNRPDVLNALVTEMREEFVNAMDEVRQDDTVRAVVIGGNGRAFSAGGDLKSFSKGVGLLEGRERLLSADRVLLTGILNLEKPVIAMVHGYATGLGCNLAMACDIVIADEEAKFSQAFVRVGLIPDFGGLWLLPKLVGLHKAKELVFSGDTLDAREAERLGLVNKVVAVAELEAATAELAERLAKGPTRAMGLAKVLMHRMLTTDLSGAIELEAFGQAVSWQTDDHKEGVRAFFEKRSPKFKGA